MGFICAVSIGDALNCIADFNITVNNGAASSAAATNGTVVRVFADVPDENKVFNAWTGDINAVADRYSPTTSVTVAGADITLTATYVNAPYKLTFLQDKTTVFGWYSAGAQIPLKARLPALFKSFKWTGGNSSDTNAVTDLSSWNTSVTMPQEDVELTAIFKPAIQSNAYLVINLSDGAISYLDTPPVNGWDNDYKDDYMVFRRIEAGTYQMGAGDFSNSDEHTVTLTEPFYIGVFEVTQGQWDNVIGGYPSSYSGSSAYDHYPVENISYDNIRGSADGRDWPADTDVDSASFVGIMRSRTGYDGFDLPTEAQWEYACRAGATNDWHVDYDDVFDVAVVSIAGHNHPPPRTNPEPVGTLIPNNWGLYDTHGNVFELCLDWLWMVNLGTSSQTDPLGALTYTSLNSYKRVKRGGCFEIYAIYTASGFRGSLGTIAGSGQTGFRMALHLNKVTVVDSAVNNGANDYVPGTKVSISAETKDDFAFAEWSVTPTETELGPLFNETEPDTIIEVPNALGHITVNATYQ